MHTGGPRKRSACTTFECSMPPESPHWSCGDLDAISHFPMGASRYLDGCRPKPSDVPYQSLMQSYL